MENYVQALRDNRIQSKTIIRGRAKKFHYLFNIYQYGLPVILLAGTLLGAIIGWFITKNGDDVLAGANNGFLISILCYAYWPIISWMYESIVNRNMLSLDFFNQFNLYQRLLGFLMTAFLLVLGFNQGYAHLFHHTNYTQLDQKLAIVRQSTASPSKANQIDRIHNEMNAFKPIQGEIHWLMIWFLTTAILWTAVYSIKQIGNRKTKRIKKAIYALMPDKHQALIKKNIKEEFKLWLGESTGQLADLFHGASMAARQKIALDISDAAQNILVLGGIGSGKTTCAIHPLLVQLLDQNAGGLIFDIKGDFEKAVLTFAHQTNRSVVLLGPGYQSINLLGGLTPEVASSFLKSTFLLGNHQDAFWIDTATELCRNTLGVLSFVPMHYSLQGLYRYLFDKMKREEIDQAISNLLPQLDFKNSELLTSYWHYHERIFDLFDEKVKAGVFATVAQVLSPFNHPELVKSFCSDESNQVSLEAVLEGFIYLVNLPLSVWGLGGKVAYSLIKLKFYNVMQKRASQSTWNQDRPIFFMCDEFQEIVSCSKDGLSDLNFWDKSRSSKTIGIISAQAISSFYASIGNQDLTHALLQNFRQKICFRTEDAATLRYFNYLTDKVEVPRISESTTSGRQDHPQSFFSTHSESYTTSTTWVDKPVISSQLFRMLSPGQAIGLFSIHGESQDDVINLMSIYV